MVEFKGNTICGKTYFKFKNTFDFDKTMFVRRGTFYLLLNKANQLTSNGISKHCSWYSKYRQER